MSLRVLLAVVLVSVLASCGSSTEMARSTAPTAARPLYSDGPDVDLGDGEVAVDEATEAPIAAEAPPVLAPTIVDSAGGLASSDAVAAEPSAPLEREEESYRTSIASESTASTGGAGSGSYTPPPNLGWGVAVEPLPWVPLDPAPVPAGPRRVLLATMEVPPGRTIFPPVSACQDVLVYVQAGALEAMGTGVGTTDAPATLYPGDAARFGPEGDGRLTNRSGEPASALIVIARDPDAGAPLYTSPVDSGLCELAVSGDPVVRPLRLASAATTAPLLVMDGHLSVRILLDLDGTASVHAGLALLEGDTAMRIAAHVHDEADEILYVEEGEGTLRVGTERVAVSAGSVLYIPHGVEHAFEPSGGRAFRAIQLYSPSGPEQRFRGM